MRKKFRRTSSVILGIFIIAVLCVVAAGVIIYQNGLRYIKSDAGIKYFGNVDVKTANILGGRFWYESDGAKTDLQKIYIIEAADSISAAFLPNHRMFFNYGYDNLRSTINSVDILREINSGLAELTPYFPMNDFIFNTGDGRVRFRKETLEVVLKDHENTGNPIIDGIIWAYGETDVEPIVWMLIPTNSNPSSYKDYEVVWEDNRAKKYKGDIIEFMKKEPVFYASLEFKNGSIIKIYSAPANLYRISYDKGPRAGDIYIGEINPNFEKHGTGLYFYGKTGDIYSGDFKNSEKTGFGMFLSGAGDSYFGEMLAGKKHGEGIFRWHDGASYSGMFADNMKNGRGKNIFADGSVYEGDYANDIKHGSGKYIWSNGDVYEGDFVNDLYEGFGKYTWASGDYYEGEFNFNTLHGEGTYVWTTGRTYRGLFSHGRMIRN